MSPTLRPPHCVHKLQEWMAKLPSCVISLELCDGPSRVSETDKDKSIFMKDTNIHTTETLCPSAQPDMNGCVAFGVVGGKIEEPRLIYLCEPQIVTDELLDLAMPVPSTEVFRFAAPCAS